VSRFSGAIVHLPSGAVTFPFTDIEGSTQLVKRLRDRYGEVLGEHQRILCEAFAAHTRRELDTGARTGSGPRTGR
jgi:class 3 adenylate cyclase